jgi:signal transduction histidine kinase
MEEKSLQLLLEGDESAEVDVDGVFLRQALVNVIHNAVKYSPPGGTIRVRVRREEPQSAVIFACAR